MNKRILFAVAAGIPMLLSAQTAVDAFSLSRNDLRGTARFMSMAGAFGALGGDLSTLGQNPGGIGVYRKSDVGITLDIEMQNQKTSSTIDSWSQSQTKALVTNVGYVGTAYTNSDVMPFFNWGFTYNRVASFNRRYKGTVDMTGSLSNYIAGYTTNEGWTWGAPDANGNPTTDYLSSSDENYFDRTHAPWMSILAFNSYMMNPVEGTTSQYNGLWDATTFGVSDFDVEEQGYVDEYDINLGGNIMDMLYWGIGLGITDIEYKQYVYYEEYLDNARRPIVGENGNIYSGPASSTGSDVGFGVDSRKHITGTGVNFKAGLIYRPINELRLGLAIHTPTYYTLTQNNDAVVDYGYGYDSGDLKPGYTGSPITDYDWKFRTPWRLILSAAGIIGSKAIVSLDYEYRPYQSMTAKFDNGDKCEDVCNDIKDYYKAANIIRLGAEYRVSRNFSVRAGYSYESTPTKSEVLNDHTMVYTSSPYDDGTTPSYTLEKSTNYITCGVGYHYKSFYADAAYVHRSRTSEFHPYTPNDYTENPMTAKVKESMNNIVLSVGFKF